MSKTQEKPLQESVQKVKKVVPKKDKAAKIVKVKPAETVKAPANKTLDKLSAHALKHVSGWHAKAGENGPEFAKLIAKHARTLLK